MGEKLRTISWLQYYGISRMLGASPERAAAICNKPSEYAAAEFEILSTSSQMKGSIAEARVKIGPEMASNIVSSIPIIGSLGSILFGVVGWLGKTIVKANEWGCHKNCKGYDARNIIGMCPGPIWHRQKMGVFGNSLHDGLVVAGLGSKDSEDSMGRVYGVRGYREESCWPAVDRGTVRGGAADNEGDRLGRYGNIGLGKQLGIPKGNASSPWKDQGNNWYWRSYRVGKLLRWVERAMPCNTLMCAADILKQTGGLAKNAAEVAFGPAPKGPLNAKDKKKWDDFIKAQAAYNHKVGEAALAVFGRTSSRWYASIFYMHQDIWTMAQQLPVDVVVQLANSKGCWEFAGRYKDIAEGKWKPPDPVKEPWPWYAATNKLTWPCAQDLIPLLSAEVMKRLPRLAPVSSLVLRKLTRFGDQPAGAAAAGAASPVRAAGYATHIRQMIHTVGVQRQEEERRERIKQIAIPIGIGAVLLIWGIGLYWYISRREQQAKPIISNLPPRDDDEDDYEWD